MQTATSETESKSLDRSICVPLASLQNTGATARAVHDRGAGFPHALGIVVLDALGGGGGVPCRGFSKPRLPQRGQNTENHYTTWLCTTSVQIIAGRATYLHSTQSNMHQIFPFHGERAQISFIVCVADSKISVFLFAFSMKSCT